MSRLSKDETGHGNSILQRNSPISPIWHQWVTAWLAALLLLSLNGLSEEVSTSATLIGLHIQAALLIERIYLCFLWAAVDGFFANARMAR